MRVFLTVASFMFRQSAVPVPVELTPMPYQIHECQLQKLLMANTGVSPFITRRVEFALLLP